MKGDLQFDPNNGNIDIDGTNGGGFLLVEGCADGAGGSDDPSKIINSGITWCVGPNGDCAARGLGSGQSENGCNIILPVTIVSFKPVLAGRFVRLEWITASEKSSDYFQIERSDDGSGFRAIGTVDAAGDSEEMTEYAFEDTESMSGTAYYRLKQVDIDGSFQYTQVIEVHIDEYTATKQLLAYPNPSSTGIFDVQANMPINHIKVISLVGIELPVQCQLFGQRAKIDLQGRKGTFLVQALTDSATLNVWVTAQ